MRVCVYWIFECRIGRHIKLDFYPFVRSFVRSFLRLALLFSFFFFVRSVLVIEIGFEFRIASHVLIPSLLCSFATLIRSMHVVRAVPIGSELRPSKSSCKLNRCNLRMIAHRVAAVVRYSTSSYIILICRFSFFFFISLLLKSGWNAQQILISDAIYLPYKLIVPQSQPKQNKSKQKMRESTNGKCKTSLDSISAFYTQKREYK